MRHYHLAQINIAHANAALDTPIMQGFVDRLDEINLLAEQSAGFVWRLQDEANGNATAIQVFDDPLIIVNMSVWENIECLQNFVYQTVHLELIKTRKHWFRKLAKAHQAMWWIDANVLPTASEGVQKLDALDRHGAGPNAFNFAKPYPPPS